MEIDQEKRDSIRASVAALCRDKYGMEISVEDVTDCDGCRSEGRRLFSGCAQSKIRSCIEGRGLASCAYCESYGCDLLQTQWKLDPEAKLRLNQLRTEMQTGGRSISWSPGTGA
jgi:hypothetical protein